MEKTRKQSKLELEQIQQNLEYSWKELRVFIADVVSPEEAKTLDLEDIMLETENLVTTYGWVVILEHIQKKTRPDFDTYIWWWRLEEIMAEMKLKWANLLILGNILKPKQIYNVNEKLKEIGAKAWDRIDLILKIFERNAKSSEAKLQIELASIKHMWPRIFDMWMELWKQWWKWKWETNTEIMKRHLQRREIAIKKDLEHFSKVRAEHRKSRSRKGLSTIWVVGYTNAWKSTLTNTLTKKWVLAEDKLFATLGTSVGKMWIQTEDYVWKEFLLNDTIWFIRDLPPELIDAFTSTLEDSIEADLLLHLIDASDPKLEEKIEVVDNILDRIWANQKKIYVFNKIDGILGKKKNIILWTSCHPELVSGSQIIDSELNSEWQTMEVDYLEYLKEKFAKYNPVFVSAYKKIGLDDLKERILKES